MAKTKELQELGKWKVGQKVTVESGGAMTYISIRPIDRITDGRGGTVYADGTAYDLHGRQRGRDGYSSARITPTTDEDRIKIAGNNSKYRMGKVNWKEISHEKAIEIEKLLNDNGIETRRIST